MDKPSKSENGRAQGEPEIIPPGREQGGTAGGPSWMWVSVDGRNGRRIRIGRPGPLALIVAALLIAAFAVVAFFVLLSAAILAIPAAIIVIAALIFSGIRRAGRRF